MLYLIATPIGNLSDFTFRAVETLKSCDLILCEDTLHSSKLLRHYGITGKTESYHSFSESKKNGKILEMLKEGNSIALLSDAGSPLVCDPGETLIAACIRENIPVTGIPGPTALIQALLLSGLPSTPFQFLGFVPKTRGEFTDLLPSVLSFPGTSIFYESPNRIGETIKILASFSPQTPVAVARELTKTFEEVLRGAAEELSTRLETSPVKGEIVLLIKGSYDRFASQDPKALVRELESVYGLTLPEAVKTAARLLTLPKQSVYKLFFQEK